MWNLRNKTNEETKENRNKILLNRTTHSQNDTSFVMVKMGCLA